MTRGNLWAPGSEPKEAAPKMALYLPGVSGNYVSCPSAAALNVAGDLDVRVKASIADMSNGNQYLIGKWVVASGLSWGFQLDSLSRPKINYSANGSTVLACLASVGAWNYIADGDLVWFRATLDIDNGAGGATARFYYSDDDAATWTQIGNAVTGTTVASLHAGTSPIEIGSWSNGANDLADNYTVHTAELRDGIDGPIVAQWNGSWPHTRQRDAYGNIWTVNGTANAWQKVSS